MAYFSQGNTSSNMQEQNNPSFLESFNFIDVMMESSHGDFHEPPLPFPHHHLNDLHTSFNHNNKFQNGPPFYHPSVYGPNNTSKAESCLLNPSFPVSGIGLLGDHNSDHTNHSHGGKKRKRNSEREVEKTGEVVHVRAKRGQATDRHSLAERLRREKINEKLRSLQDLVPGCYKAMGMAVMLDVIVDYVRSLQNQIEFLSMKLSAASLFYDFNSSETEAMETMQGTNGYEAQLVMERMAGGAYGGGSAFPHFQSSWPI